MAEDENGKSAGFGLILSFSGLYATMPEEHAFVHGVEFGKLWERMVGGSESEIEGTFHSANKTIIERACASQGWDCEVQVATDESGKVFDEWLFAKLTKARASKPNPHGLKVVSR